MRSLLDSSPDFIMNVDRDGTILFINRTASGATVTETQGRSCYEYVPPEYHELYRQAISGRDQPRTLDLDISGIRRLRILVDFGERLDIADHLHLCNARILK